MKIDIVKIGLDINNFRHKSVQTEREAMHVLLSDERNHKVAELAEDIINMKGLDPSSHLIVTQHPTAAGEYIALEGNRRITALKTLINPEIAKDLPTYQTFKRLSGPFLALNLKQVECTELDRETAFEWIKRKHYKGMGGKGVLEWGAMATARSDASEGRFAKWMTALNYLEANGVNTDSITAAIANKTTTVERVLGSSHFGKVLGIAFDKDGNLIPENGDTGAATQLVKTLMEDMSRKSFVETEVTNGDLQLIYINRFEHLNVRKVHPATSSSAGTSSASSASSSASNAGGTAASSGGGGSGSSATGPAQAQNVTQPSTRSRPVKQRKFLAKNGLRIKNDGLNKLYAELRKLNVESNPHIGSSMQRIFLEKATMVFLESMTVACPHPNGWHDSNNKLRTKVAHVLNVVDPAKNDKNLDYARDIANATQDKTHTLDHLNEAIHNHKSIPSPLEIITAWDRLHGYYLKLFEHLETNGK